MSPSEAARVVEALLFAAEAPVRADELAAHLPEDADLRAALDELQAHYGGRGIRLERHGDAWAFRTAPDVAPFLERRVERTRRLSPAAMETLAIVAYHQPVTRAEIEAIRGVAVGKGTLDLLLDAGWVRPAGRRETPGRPVMFATTEAFLDAFDLARLADLPQRDELDRLGLLDRTDIAEPDIAEEGAEQADA
jgi:segregation and condensation protein B